MIIYPNACSYWMQNHLQMEDDLLFSSFKLYYKEEIEEDIDALLRFLMAKEAIDGHLAERLSEIWEDWKRNPRP